MTYPFVAGETLTAAAMNTIGLFYVKTQTISGTPSSVTITSAFSSDFDNYRIIGHNLVTSGAGNDIEMELGNGGSHTSGYYGNTTKFAYNVSGVVHANIQNTGPMPIAIDNTAIQGPGIDVTLYGPQQAGFTSWQQKGASIRAYDVNGWYNVGTQFTSVTFECTVGNWTGGEFRVYGIVDG